MKNPFVFRPFTIIGTILALHTIIVGYGFVTQENVRQTPLFKAVESLLPATVFGIVVMLVGLSVMLSYLSGREAVVNFTASLQTMVWIFVTIAYCISGAYFLALQNALPWVFLSSYVAMAFGNKKFWLDSDNSNMLR